MSDPLVLDGVDLDADPSACWIVKDEVVEVEFADRAGDLQSAVGVNHYLAGDALLTGSTGDRWCVSRARFDAKHTAEMPTRQGQAGRYRNLPNPIRGKRLSVPFTVMRSAGGDRLRGAAGDWLVQYAPGDHGIVARTRFEAVYRVLTSRPIAGR